MALSWNKLCVTAICIFTILNFSWRAELRDASNFQGERYDIVFTWTNGSDPLKIKVYISISLTEVSIGIRKIFRNI
jgi:hypothetical protein